MSQTTQQLTGTVQLGSNHYRWQVWDGQQLGPHVALDTETTLIEDYQIPRLCMLSLSDGAKHFVARPDQAAPLLEQHTDAQWIMHNGAFDFWVLDKYFAASGAETARSWLWTAVDQQRWHDTMLLSGLVQLAVEDNPVLPRLADACRRQLGYDLDKDTYRLRYAETIDTDWEQLDPGFFAYAAGDAIATWQLYCKLTHQADEICQQHQLPRQYGFLTEALQVKAAICLAAITRTGLHIDLQRAGELRQRVDHDIQKAIETMEEIDPELWHRYKKTGQRKTTKDTGLPKLNQTKLLQHFAEIAAECRLNIPETATGKLTTSVNRYWSGFRELHPLVDAYCRYAEQTKLRTFFDGLQQPTIHPRYQTMVRTGRTSCSGPNIQQMPRSSPIREAIVARPGHLLFIIDYNSLELRTLATVCYQQFGFSRLREVLIEGIDPHSYTAAMFAGVTPDEFDQLPDRKQLRQRAKVFNFGLPAGFGADSLVKHAKFNYGVTLTKEEAERFIETLTQQVYPELQLYLAEDTVAILAAVLRADVGQLRATWSKPSHIGLVRRILAGKSHRADGRPYQTLTIDRVWLQLQGMCNNPQLMPHILQRNTAADSPLRKLLHSEVSTTTGRMRGRVSFTAAKNAPFQGLAADGCKQAMWNLTKTGYRVVAFIHDEFIIELSKLDKMDQAAADIERICSDSMQPFVPGIPVPCEFALCDRWQKGAEAVFDDAGRLQVWQPDEPKTADPE